VHVQVLAHNLAIVGYDQVVVAQDVVQVLCTQRAEHLQVLENDDQENDIAFHQMAEEPTVCTSRYTELPHASKKAKQFRPHPVEKYKLLPEEKKSPSCGEHAESYARMVSKMGKSGRSRNWSGRLGTVHVERELDAMP